LQTPLRLFGRTVYDIRREVSIPILRFFFDFFAKKRCHLALVPEIEIWLC